jgi:hypothetical protein
VMPPPAMSRTRAFATRAVDPRQRSPECDFIARSVYNDQPGGGWQSR